jgi:hypothetical protein
MLKASAAAGQEISGVEDVGPGLSLVALYFLGPARRVRVDRHEHGFRLRQLLSDFAHKRLEFIGSGTAETIGLRLGTLWISFGMLGD